MLRIAWRNLWRRRGRTLIIGSAIALSYALMLVFMGIGEDMYLSMTKSAAKTAGGDVLIHEKGYWDAQTVDYTIKEPDTVLTTAGRTEGVRQLIPRVIANGLATSSTGNEGIRMMGIVPEKESALRDLSDDLIKGTFLEKPDPKTPSIVITEELADKLDVKLGHKVVLTATEIDGEMTRVLFRLRGIMKSRLGSQTGYIGYTSVDALQKALGMGDKLTQIGVVASESTAPEKLSQKLRMELDDETLEVLSWSEAIPTMKRFIELDEAFSYLYLAIIFIVVVFSIANTFLMAVMERVRELGLLNAIGLNPRRIGELILWETLFLTLLAQLLGFVIGYSVHLYIAQVGIDLASFGMDNMELGGVGLTDMVMRSDINLTKWMTGTFVVFISTLASALYPAWKAAKLAPAKAMTFYE